MAVIAIGNDHGGLEYKQKLVKHLESLGYEVLNVGTDTSDSCHYPLYAAAVAKAVALNQAEFGVVICTSGEGVCMTANKIHGVRCGIAYNDEVAALMRQHNDANVIAFGQKFMTYEDVERRLDIFLNTKFEGGRHATRVELMSDFEQ